MPRRLNYVVEPACSPSVTGRFERRFEEERRVKTINAQSEKCYSGRADADAAPPQFNAPRRSSAKTRRLNRQCVNWLCHCLNRRLRIGAQKGLDCAGGPKLAAIDSRKYFFSLLRWHLSTKVRLTFLNIRARERRNTNGPIRRDRSDMSIDARGEIHWRHPAFRNT